jgi:hypothetical protein
MQPSDKELDDLSREAAENFEATGAVPDWEGMNALLQQELPVQKNRRRKPLLILLFLSLLLGSGLLFLYTTQRNEPVEPGSKTAEIKDKTGGEQIIPKKTAGNETESNAAPRAQPLRPALSPAGTEQGITTTSDRIIKPGRQINRRAAGYKQITLTPGSAEEYPSPLARAERPAGGKPGYPGETGDVTKTPPDQLIQLPRATSDTINVVVNQMDQKGKEPGPGPVTNAETDSVQTAPKKTKQQQQSRFEISLLYAPELTTIAFSNVDQPGGSIGLLVGYHVSDKLVLQSGVIKSRKYYTADGKDFKLNYTVNYPYKLSEVTGYCNMYEIPVNVKYRVTNSKKIKTYALAGLSSYIMTREAYTYKYTSSYGNYNRNVNDASQKNYWFSLATLGVCVEKNITSSITAGATPFIKIPFKGMGTGDLKLISTGINFSLTYRPAFTR